MTGFAPNSTITVSSNYSAVNCVGEARSDSWSNPTGATTDANGNADYGVVHQDTGTYTYTFADQQGNSVSVTFTTSTDGSSTAPDVDNGPSPTPVFLDDCSQSPGNNLVIGVTGYVNANGANVNLRNQASETATVLWSMPDQTTFTILDGPVCTNGIWWWQIDVGGTVGWAAGNLLQMGGESAATLVSTSVITDVPIGDTPTVTNQAPTLQPPLYPQAQINGGIHVQIYCQSKYGGTEYREPGNAYSWACDTGDGRIPVDFQLACSEVYGEGWSATLSNATEIGSWQCSQQPGYVAPPVTNPEPQHSTNPHPCHVTEVSRNPATSPIRLGTVITFFYRVNCDNGLPRAVRYEIDGHPQGESATSELAFQVNTSDLSIGLHTICLTGASHGDEQWEMAARQCFDYTLTNQNADYPPPPADFTCPGTLSSNIRVGMIGVVNTETSASLQVRHNASSSSPVKFEIPAGQTFSVISGPQCVDGYVWWEVGSDGNSGWAIEVGSNGYEFFPNGTALPTPTDQTSDDSGGNPSPDSGNSSVPAQGTTYIAGSTVAPAGSYVFVPQGVNTLTLYENRESFPIIGTLVEENYYELLRATFDWVNIRTSAGDGWVASQYLLIIQQSVDEEPNISTLTAIGAWFHTNYEHIACAVFSVPTTIDAHSMQYRAWFQDTDGTTVSAGYYSDGPGMEQQFNVTTPNNGYLWAVCISGRYFFLQNPSILLPNSDQAEQMTNPQNWRLEIQP
jgi:uncharacterized protein YraI